MTGFFGSLELIRKTSSAERSEGRLMGVDKWGHLQRSCCLKTEDALTQFIEVRIDAVGTGHGAQEPGLEESGPLVDQAPVAPHVILHKHAHTT